MTIQALNLGTPPTGTGGDTDRSAFAKLNANFQDTGNAASRLVGTAPGNIAPVGQFGFGGGGSSIGSPANLVAVKAALNNQSQIIRSESQGFMMQYSPSFYMRAGDTNVILSVGINTGDVMVTTWADGDTDFRKKYTLRSSLNTTVDGNGFVKTASPIVHLYADKIELNDEAKPQNISFVKNGVGDYFIKGSSGFAQSGWYIETPKDANGNVLVATIYKQLENGDISVKTYAKTFDDETGDIIANLAKPRDIPVNRWIDLRLQELPKSEV